MKTGIVGYGKMGRGIFSLLSDVGNAATVYVRDPVKAEEQQRKLEKRLLRSARSGLLTEPELRHRRETLRFTAILNDLSDCDLIIETIVEDFETKTDILRRVEALVSPQSLITSNTSSLSITDLGARLEQPERFCGLHFFHPLQLTSVVEIIRSNKTGKDTITQLEDMCRRVLKKRPLLVKDLPGSCINVPLSFQISECLYILEQGIALPSRIDAIADTIVRTTPCLSADIVGLPLVTAATERSLRFLPASFSVPDLGRKLLEDGREGKSVSRGIYLYKDDRPIDDNIDYYRNPQQTHSRAGRRDDEALCERVIAPVYYAILLMATLELGSIEDLCAGVADVIGTKVNPLEQMNRRGRRGMEEMFSRLSAELGPRYDWRPIKGALSSLSAG